MTQMRRLMRLLILLVSLVSLGLALSTSPLRLSAQSNQLNYGDVVEGNITDSDFEIGYTFAGQKGDIIAIIMSRLGYSDGLANPEIVLLDSRNKVVASTTKHFSVFAATLVVPLEASETYTILATRRNGRSGDSQGRFKLELLKPIQLEDDKEVSDKVSSENMKFYIVVANGPFVIHYEKISGQFYPAVSVNSIDPETNRLNEVAQLQGKELGAGQMSIEPTAEGIYVVQVKQGLLDIYFEEVFAEYTLRLEYLK